MSLKVTLRIRGKKVGDVEIDRLTMPGSGRISSDYAWRVIGKDINGKSYGKCGWLVDSCNGNAMALLQEVLEAWTGNGTLTDNHCNLIDEKKYFGKTAEEYWKER